MTRHVLLVTAMLGEAQVLSYGDTPIKCTVPYSRNQTNRTCCTAEPRL